MKSRNGRNYVISHDFLYIEKTKKNKKCTISVNIAPIRMKQLPFDSPRLDESNELTFIDFGSSRLEIFAIECQNPDFFIYRSFQNGAIINHMTSWYKLPNFGEIFLFLSNSR